MEQYINLLLDAFVTLLIPEKGKTAVHGCHGGQLPPPYLMIFFETAIFFSLKRLFYIWQVRWVNLSLNCSHFYAIFFQPAVLTLKRIKRDGLWSGFAWTGFCCQSSGILWLKKFPNTTHPSRVHMELTRKSMEDIRLMMGHLSWTMEASTITGGILRKNCVHMITKLERLKTWVNFILSHTWPSLQVLRTSRVTCPFGVTNNVCH